MGNEDLITACIAWGAPLLCAPESAGRSPLALALGEESPGSTGQSAR